MHLFIYVAALGLNCGMWESLVAACRIFFFFFLVVACKLLVVACGISFPDQRSNLDPLHWQHGILANQGSPLLYFSESALGQCQYRQISKT